MHRTILLTSAMLLLAWPAAARDLDPSAGDNGVTGGGAGSYSDDPNDEHPNAEGQTFSYPSCGTSCGSASGKDTSEGSVSGGSSGNGNGNGNDQNGYGNTGSL